VKYTAQHYGETSATTLVIKMKESRVMSASTMEREFTSIRVCTERTAGHTRARPGRSDGPRASAVHRPDHRNRATGRTPVDEAPSSDAGARPDRAGPVLDPPELINSLYAEHGAVLRNYITRILCDPNLAEDVVQETMLRAWHNAALLIPERGSVAGWLMRVGHNIAVDKIRARKARPDEIHEGAVAPLSQADHATQVIDSLHLARTLARLSQAHREVLVLIYFADHTAAQAAEALGLPVGTVKSRAFNALRRLRRYFAEDMTETAATDSHG
jgi:RNA polymerase sigma-70 factor (ECF subfamily)